FPDVTSRRHVPAPSPGAKSRRHVPAPSPGAKIGTTSRKLWPWRGPEATTSRKLCRSLSPAGEVVVLRDAGLHGDSPGRARRSTARRHVVVKDLNLVGRDADRLGLRDGVNGGSVGYQRVHCRLRAACGVIDIRYDTIMTSLLMPVKWYTTPPAQHPSLAGI